MLSIKATSKYSNMIVIKEDLSSLLVKSREPIKIIQMIYEDNWLFVEYIPEENLELYYNENKSKQIDPDLTPCEDPIMDKEKELQNALDTVLNKDPQSKYGGQTLRYIFDRHDVEWVNWVLENMHNKFIRDKVQLILDSGYWGE